MKQAEFAQIGQQFSGSGEHGAPWVDEREFIVTREGLFFHQGEDITLKKGDKLIVTTTGTTGYGPVVNTYRDIIYGT